MNGRSPEFSALLHAIDSIDQGNEVPIIPGRAGLFLRQYGAAREQINRILDDFRVVRRADEAVSGRQFGPISIHPLHRPKLRSLGKRLGDVAESLAVCEELGGIVRVRTWIKSQTASEVYRPFETGRGVQLSGDYRWTPPFGLTPGGATVVSAPENVGWQQARSLKVVADDLDRSSHALEYLSDYALGLPSLKLFKTACVLRDGSDWVVVPALDSPKRLSIAGVLHRAETPLRTASRAVLLIYREPWTRDWTIADAVEINAAGVFAHVVAWADFYHELDGDELPADVYRGLRQTARDMGLDVSEKGETNLTRRLFPIIRELLRRIRGRS